MDPIYSAQTLNRVIPMMGTRKNRPFKTQSPCRTLDPSSRQDMGIFSKAGCFDLGSVGFKVSRV